MRVLLDTRTLLWWALDDATLSLKARAVLASLGSEIPVSAASAVLSLCGKTRGKA